MSNSTPITIRIVRVDGMQAAALPGEQRTPLSDERFPNWEAAFQSMRARGVPLTTEHEAEFRAHDGTQFQHREMVDAPGAVYYAVVHYDVRVVSEATP